MQRLSLINFRISAPCYAQRSNAQSEPCTAMQRLSFVGLFKQRLPKLIAAHLSQVFFWSLQGQVKHRLAETTKAKNHFVNLVRC